MDDDLYKLLIILGLLVLGSWVLVWIMTSIKAAPPLKARPIPLHRYFLFCALLASATLLFWGASAQAAKQLPQPTEARLCPDGLQMGDGTTVLSAPYWMSWNDYVRFLDAEATCQSDQVVARGRRLR